MMKNLNLVLVRDYLARTAEGLESLSNSTAERVVLTVKEEAEIENARRQIKREEAGRIYRTRQKRKK